LPNLPTSRPAGTTRSHWQSLANSVTLIVCSQDQRATLQKEHPMPRRFFAPDSFWNTPIGPCPAIDPDSGKWIDLLVRNEPVPNFWINTNAYTIPVHEVDEATPRRLVRSGTNPYAPKASCHGATFENPVPIPDSAAPDAGADGSADGHAAFIDYARGKVWDMLVARKHKDGSWEAQSAMTYSLDGSGAFDHSDFPVKDGESIHLYGPGRAAGVPIIAGLIMRAEVEAGRIEHKLAFATWWNEERKYVYPATWTDGFTPGGPLEGGVIQLDPTLDLAPFNLSPGGLAVARALQQYGAVNVDIAAGTVLYAEGLYDKAGPRSWKGLLESDALRGIDLRHYRFLRCDNIQHGGLKRPVPPRSF
jgi:hypothetical protein